MPILRRNSWRRPLPDLGKQKQISIPDFADAINRADFSKVLKLLSAEVIGMTF